MKAAIFYDFETSGLPLFREPSDDPRQPHIVQAAAALVDLDTWKTIQSINLIARPDGWEIPDDVAEIHGITTEYALEVGVNEETIAYALLDLWGWPTYEPRLRIAHNETFDARIMRIALKRLQFHSIDLVRWREGPAECTAQMATPIMQMAPTEKMKAAGFNHSKKPKLTEAYEYFTGSKLENAHSAMADVEGCIAVYRECKYRATLAQA